MKKMGIFLGLILAGVLITKAVLADNPLPPANFLATSTSPTSANLSWDAATSTVGYKIYRDSASNLIATTSALSYLDTGLAPDTDYNYYLSGYDAENANSTTASASVKTLKDLVAPAVPQDLTGQAISDTQIDLSWNASADNVGTVGYKIYRNGLLAATTTLNSFSNTGLAAGTAYTFSVSAYDAAENVSVNSSQITITTKSAPLTPAAETGWAIKIENGLAGKLINLRSNQIVKIRITASNASTSAPDLNSVSFGGAIPETIKRDKPKGNIMDYTFEFRAREMSGLYDGDNKATFQMTTKNGQLVEKDFSVIIKNGPKKVVKIIDEKIKKVISAVKNSCKK